MACQISSAVTPATRGAFASFAGSGGASSRFTPLPPSPVGDVGASGSPPRGEDQPAPLNGISTRLALELGAAAGVPASAGSVAGLPLGSTAGEYSLPEPKSSSS